MTRLLLPLAVFPLLLAAGCATSRAPYAPVRDVAYQAIGWHPAWTLAIGDDRIVLRTAGGGERSWPRVLPRTLDGIRSWRSDDGPGRIEVTARPGPCQSPARAEGRRVFNYEHHVLVTIGGEAERFAGCGGRLVERAERR